MQRYILTDVGNILTRFKQRSQLIKEIMAGFGVTSLDWAKMVPASHVLHEEGNYHGLDVGMFSVRQVWEELIGHHRIPEDRCSYPLFLSLWCKHLEPIQEVVNLYRELQERFPLVAVSNGDGEGTRHILYHLIGTHGLKFHEIFISAERKEKKPGLLRQVADFIVAGGAQLKDCVFIDDILEYTEAACMLGIKAITFNGSEQSVEDLKIGLQKLGFC